MKIQVSQPAGSSGEEGGVAGERQTVEEGLGQQNELKRRERGMDRCDSLPKK